jgi:hypothetical protein
MSAARSRPRAPPPPDLQADPELVVGVESQQVVRVHARVAAGGPVVVPDEPSSQADAHVALAEVAMDAGVPEQLAIVAALGRIEGAMPIVEAAVDDEAAVAGPGEVAAEAGGREGL